MDAEKSIVWSRGRPIPGMDPDEVRSDDYGFTIKFVEFGTQDPLAWEMERKFGKGTEWEYVPVSKYRIERIFTHPSIPMQ